MAITAVREGNKVVITGLGAGVKRMTKADLQQALTAARYNALSHDKTHDWQQYVSTYREALKLFEPQKQVA